MVGSGVYPKSDGDIWYAHDVNGLTKFGGTGSDGALNTTGNLSLTAGQVYNYTTGAINNGHIVSLSGSTNGIPLILKFTGDLTISGDINVDGKGYSGGSRSIGDTKRAAYGEGYFKCDNYYSNSFSMTDYLVLAGGGGQGGAAGDSGGAGSAGGGGGGGCGLSSSGSNGSAGAGGAGGELGLGALKYTIPYIQSSTLYDYLKHYMWAMGTGGGGGGQGTSGYIAGDGGDGGGMIWIECLGNITLNNTGTLSADGDNGIAGSSPGAGNYASGGGGGGGGGSIVILASGSITDNGITTSVTGGTGGAGGTGGLGNGGAGGAGGTGLFVKRANITY
ncbi:MAG: hypothetical protein ACTSXD_08490 [Candidatus Heimdallarchaeaceae archaeon]